MKHEDITDELVEAILALTTSVRMAEGLKPELVSRVENALNVAAEQWRGQAMIPKRAANVLAELAPWVEGASYLYNGEESERIREYSIHLGELVLKCLAV